MYKYDLLRFKHIVSDLSSLDTPLKIATCMHKCSHLKPLREIKTNF